MRFLTRAGVYGIRAALYLAAQDEPTASPVRIKDIADSLDISFHFLTKILQRLTEKGIVKAVRGPNGGVVLAHPPNEIMLLDLLTVLEGADFFEGCILGLKECSDERPCPAHTLWKPARTSLHLLFETSSLLDMGEKILTGEIHIN